MEVLTKICVVDSGVVLATKGVCVPVSVAVSEKKRNIRVEYPVDRNKFSLYKGLSPV